MRGELDRMAAEHSAAQDGHKDAHQAAMEQMDAAMKAEIERLHSKHDAASEEAARRLEEQERAMRGELDRMSAEHSAAQDGHKDAHQAAMEQMDAAMKAEIARLHSKHD